jgi:ADP-L-glycero-D-manno-heptose 6-epimerase
MKIIVTGHKGFIGQNMVKALEANGNFLKCYEWGDNLPDIRGYDWVIHLGAISSTTETDVEKIIDQNYDFSRWLLMECHKHNVNFQYASSASVYGTNATNFAEDAPMNPQSPYAWSKFLFDRFAMKISVGWNIFVQGFRYFNVYGPYEDHKGDQASPYYKFEQQAKETGVIKLFEGSESFVRDFVPVEKVVDVHQRFFGVSESGIWNVGTGRPTSFTSIARTIADRYDSRIEYIPMPENISKQYQKYTCADLTKLNTHYNVT